MPQATPELRDRWDEARAWGQLDGVAVDDGGVIRFWPDYNPTEVDLSAVDYLCQEWDYDYVNKPSNVY